MRGAHAVWPLFGSGDPWWSSCAYEPRLPRRSGEAREYAGRRPHTLHDGVDHPLCFAVWAGEGVRAEHAVQQGGPRYPGWTLSPWWQQCVRWQQGGPRGGRWPDGDNGSPSGSRRCENAMVVNQVFSGLGHNRSQSCNELKGGHQQAVGPVGSRPFEPEVEIAVFGKT